MHKAPNNVNRILYPCNLGAPTPMSGQEIPENVAPANYVRVTRRDHIRFQYINGGRGDANIQLELISTILKPNGDLVKYSSTYTLPASTAVWNTEDIRVTDEGYLISCFVKSVGATVPITGEVYVELYLLREGQEVIFLTSGNIAGDGWFQRVCFPYIPPTQAHFTQPGFLRTINLTNPNGGSQLSYNTVANMTIYSIRLQIQCNGDQEDRYMVLNIDSDDPISITFPQVILANERHYFHILPMSVGENYWGGITGAAYPIQYATMQPLKVHHVVNISTSVWGLRPGDAIANVKFYVEQWG